MDSNRLRYKQVASKFHSADDSRAVRAITQEDRRRVRRSNVVHIRRNIPDTLSSEPSPSVSHVASTKKSLASAAVVAKAKASIMRLALDDSNARKKKSASPRIVSQSINKKLSSPIVKILAKNSPPASQIKANKSSKLIGGKTLEELRNERMERLKLFKQLKQRKQQQEKASRKPSFWLGVAKREPKVLLLPSNPEPKGPARSATPAKSHTPIWHSGLSVSKRPAPAGPAPSSANKTKVLKSSRNIFTNATPGVGASSRAASRQLLIGARGRVVGKPGHEKLRSNENVSFAPKGYKFSAPSGLQQISARAPTPRRPSIRFSDVTPSVTPPKSGPRRMPRTKTPRPNSRVPARPAGSSESSESSSSDERPENSRVQDISIQNKSPNEASEPSSHGLLSSPETGRVKAKKSQRRSSELSLNGNVIEVPANDSSKIVYFSSDSEALEGQNLKVLDVSEKRPSVQRTAKQRGSGTTEESHSGNEEEEKCSPMEVDNERTVAVTPPNTEFSYAVLADSLKKKSSERSISKVSRSTSIKKSNLVAKLNMSASDESLAVNVKSPLVTERTVVESAGKKNRSAHQTPVTENGPNLREEEHSSSVSEEKEFQANLSTSLKLASSSLSLSPSPVSSLVDSRATHVNSSTTTQDQRPSTPKSSNRKASVEYSLHFTAPAPDECGCSPELLPMGRKRKSVLKIVTPPAAVAGCVSHTPASVQLGRSVRRSARIASVPSNAGDSDGGLRTPSHASQRTTATTPCSRSTRRSLAVHAASTWGEFCAATPQPPSHAKTPRGRRKTIADEDNVPPIEENPSSQVKYQSASKTRGRKGRRRTIAALSQSDNVAPNKPYPQSERKTISKTPGHKSRRKTVISSAQNGVVDQNYAHSLENDTDTVQHLEFEASGTEVATTAAANMEQELGNSLLGQTNGVQNFSPRSGSQKKRKLTTCSATPEETSTYAAKQSSEHRRRVITAPTFSAQSASSGASLSAGSSLPDVSSLPLDSPFVNTESRARKRRKHALKEASFMDEVGDILHSLERNGEVRDDTVTTDNEASTNPELWAELLRPTTPCSAGDVSINVWDNTSPVRETVGCAETKENKNPESKICSDKRKSKSKRRSSLREGALLGALKARNESTLHSRVSLGLFANGSLQSPDVAASVTDGSDLISWESPESTHEMEDEAMDQLRVDSPKPRSGSIRGKKVGRLAALYEQTAMSLSPSPVAPGSTRRSTRLSHLTPA